MHIKRPLLVALLASCSAFGSNPANASTTYGTLSNFDVFNDSSTERYYGFEIELEGLDVSSIPNYNGSYYTFHNSNYGAGDISNVNGKTIVRYFDETGANSTAPYTTPITHTDGHSCINTPGCEHFGLALNSQPTASRYYWLNQAGNRSTQVNLIGMPIISVAPQPPAANGAAQPAQVQFVMEAPEEPEGHDSKQKFSDAVWVKVMKAELDLEHMADLDDLMAHKPEKIADAEQDGVEVEWKLLQRRFNPDLNDPEQVANNKLDSGEQAAGENAEQVLRTYQFYAFTGDYSEEHEAVCSAIGTCEDDLQEDPANIDRFVGRLIGQQMVAANLNGPVVFPAEVPVPGAVWLFGSALMGFTGIARRKIRSFSR